MNQKIKLYQKKIGWIYQKIYRQKKPEGRGPPSYKTWEGDIYVRPFENGEIIKTWFNIYI